MNPIIIGGKKEKRILPLGASKNEAEGIMSARSSNMSCDSENESYWVA